jgi:hypothetical protein
MIEDKSSSCFISTGSLSSFYTLRVFRLDYDGRGRAYNREVFVKNLSTDKVKALEEAQTYAEENDLILMNNPDFDLNEIKRMKQEDSQRRIKEKREKEEREKAEKNEAFEKTIKSLIFINGKYSGSRLEEVFKKDPGYVYYLNGLWRSNLSNCYENINVHIAHRWITENDMKSEFIGTNGKLEEFELTYNSQFELYGRFLTIKHNCSLGGNLVMFNSSAKGFMELKSGDIFKVKGTVSHYNHSNGNKITILNKPKIVK